MKEASTWNLSIYSLDYEAVLSRRGNVSSVSLLDILLGRNSIMPVGARA
jgi:hypothetical protein